MHSRAVVLLTVPAGPDDKAYRLGQIERHELHRALNSIELRNWTDGFWSCIYGFSGLFAVDLGNMTLAEWFRREQYHWTF